ncbi:MAG: DUF2752 domain-containing protein [Prevotella sp.]|jgi:hypothetical protein|nr:DUF2752 domain-containing protein [Prevotella sp.]
MKTSISELKETKAYKQVKLFIITFAPVVLFFIPVAWLNRQHSICLYKNITGHDCFGCGITRAVLSVLHFDFGTAFHYNKMVVIVFPLLVYIWVNKIVKLIKELNDKSNLKEL